MPGVQDHEMVQAVSPYRADQAFDIRILPGTLARCEQVREAALVSIGEIRNPRLAKTAHDALEDKA